MANNILLQGKVQSGNCLNTQYLSNYIVSLYQSNLHHATLISETITDINGSYNFILNSIDSNSIYYLTAEFENIKLISIIGSPIDNNYNIINELSTIAALYCFNNFYTQNSIYGLYKGLNTAYMMYLNFVNNFGTLSEVIMSPPNANQTNTLQLLNSLGNILAICIKNVEIYNNLIVYTTTLLHKPVNTVDIFVSIIRNPANNVSLIFGTSLIYKIFTPFLQFSNVPDAFTLAIKVNNSGNINNLIAGPGNIIFDDNGNAWITNNVLQGTPNSCNFIVVLKPNGQPTDFSPIISDSIIGQGFGVAKLNDKIISGNFGWGNVYPEGGLSVFSQDGYSITNKEILAGTYRVQGIDVDTNNNVWVASYGNDKVIVYIGGDFLNRREYVLPNNSFPFDVITDSKGNAIITLSGSATPYVPASLLKLYLGANNEIVPVFNVNIGNKLLGLDVDSKGNIFVASSLDLSVYKIDQYGNMVQKISNPQLGNPWSCTVDANDNVWVANFTPVSNSNVYGVSCFTNNGIPITPSTGYTLPSGGDQVLLYSGEPLSGYGSIPNYSPLMRQTATAIDIAGNLWVLNNWKPYIPQDSNNPGGDGIVIFIGIGNNKL